MAKNPINTRLEKAVGLHQAGQFAEAEKLYDQILALDRANPDALNLKGIIANTQGRHGEALALFERAATVLPNFPEFPFNRGLALAALGRTEEALQSYLRAIALNPAYADAHLNAGLLLHTMGRTTDAVAAFRIMTQRAPNDPRGFYNLGVCLEKSLPAAAEAERPSLAEEARAAFTCAAALDPNNPEVHFAFANLHHFLGEYDQAIARLETALNLNPAWSDAWHNLGSQFEARGRREEAIAAFDRAAALNPADAASAVNRGMTYLAMGRLAEGWEGYARRFEDARFPFVKRDWPWRAWQGEDLAGKSILVWSDQGIGDEVMYASLLPEVVARAGRCVVECAPRLAPLYRRSFPGMQVLPNTPETRRKLLARGFDFQSSVLDLGRWLRPSLAAFPNRRSVLSADPSKTAVLRAKYRARSAGRPLIGLSWRSITPDMSHQKSLTLEALVPLLLSTRLTFVSLQYGDVGAEVNAVRRQHDVEIIIDSDIDSLRNLDAFAAQVAALDAIVTISNTGAHFAGALGVPTWLLVPRGHKQLWYWFGEGRFSPWYRSIRVVRETPPSSLARLTNILETCRFRSKPLPA